MRNNLEDALASKLRSKNGRIGVLRTAFTGTRVLNAESPTAHFLDPGAVADGSVYLPALDQIGGQFYYIAHVGTAKYINVYSSDGVLLTSIPPRDFMNFVASHREWKIIRGINGASLPVINTNFMDGVSSANTMLALVQGTAANPVTYNDPVATIQKTSNYTVPGKNATLYISHTNESLATNIEVSGIFSEVIDPKGIPGSSIVAVGGSAVWSGANAEGSVFSGSAVIPAGVPHTFVNTLEADVINNSGVFGAAPMVFSTASWIFAVQMSTQGNTKIDAFLGSNAFGTFNGARHFLICAPGTVEGSIIYAAATTEYGIDLAHGTQSIAGMRLPNASKIVGVNAANTLNLDLFLLDGSDELRLGTGLAADKRIRLPLQNPLAWVGASATAALTSQAAQVANNGIMPLSSAGVAPFGMITIYDSNNEMAIYLLNGTVHATKEVFDPDGVFTVTAGNVGTVNIYWSAGNARYELENKRGFTASFAVQYSTVT